MLYISSYLKSAFHGKNFLPSVTFNDVINPLHQMTVLHDVRRHYVGCSNDAPISTYPKYTVNKGAGVIRHTMFMTLKVMRRRHSDHWYYDASRKSKNSQASLSEVGS